MTIHKKLVFAMVSIAVLSMGAYLLVASWQSQRQSESARMQIRELVDSSTVDTSAAIIRLITAQNEALTKQVGSELNVARAVLKDAGPISMGKDLVRWGAENQFTHKVTNVEIPRMLFGGRWLGQNQDPWVRTPIIDDEFALVGGTMTIYQRMNPQGDMLRIATNVEMDSGMRPIGTYIPHLGRNDKPNVVVATLLQGKTYRGVAWVVNHYYVTCYEPIRDSSGVVIGAIYTGERQENGAGLRDAILRAQVGKSGRILVLAGSGEKRGKCLMAQDDREGDDLSHAKDSYGFPYVSEIMHAAANLKDGQSAIVRYTLGDGNKRVEVTARVAYYHPWDWIVVTEAHPQDFAAVYERLYNSGNATVVAFLLICGAMLLLTLPMLWADATERARREAERANAAKSEFLSRMSHELRTPLNAILGFAQILQMDDLNSDQEDSVGHIRTAGEHLLKLINEVLDMSRIESGAMLMVMEPVPLHKIGSEVRALLLPLAEDRKIAFEVDLCGDEPHYVIADNHRLKQVLINLVSNAIKYNRPEGSVRISCSPAGKGHCRIQVSDTGPGIPSDRVSSIFTPFDRLGAENTNVEGTGLGLALSKHLVEQMSGKISFESGPGGTSFFVDLPESPAPANSQDTKASA
jgi:signal transduction histidine kinase